MNIKFAGLAIFSFIAIMIIPAYADVNNAELDKETFTINDKFTISGTVSDAERTMLTAVMKGENGEKLIKNQRSDPDGTYSFIPINADLLFNSKGVYTITVFTENQPFDTGVEIKIAYEKSVADVLPDYTLELTDIENKGVNETEELTFTASVTDSTISVLEFSLENEPSGATINENSGVFSWTPTDIQSGNYILDIVVKSGPLEDRETITVTVIDKPEPVVEPEPEPVVEPEPEPVSESIELGVASFVDETKDAQTYVDRYNNEASYKEWFDANYSEYDSIYQAVGLEEPTVVVEEPEIIEPEFGECGEGTELVGDTCEMVAESNGGGCLIATATYGSELAPQVQLLREIRDNQLMNTGSGESFMTEFNQFYYSFSPIIADMERENPIFKELVKIGITPLLSSLTVLSFAESESEVIGYGIGVIMMNIGMYFVAPAIIIFKARKYIKI